MEKSNKNVSKTRCDIGCRIGQVSEMRGLTQAALASLVGESPRTITHWENATRDIRTESLIKLSKALNVSSDYLLGLTKTASPNVTIRGICSKTGLSEAAVEALISANDDLDVNSWNMLTFISALITAPGGVWESISLNAARYSALSKKENLTQEEYDKMLVSLFACQEFMKEFIKGIDWKEG